MVSSSCCTALRERLRSKPKLAASAFGLRSKTSVTYAPFELILIRATLRTLSVLGAAVYRNGYSAYVFWHRAG